jgi:hypothetical protein
MSHSKSATRSLFCILALLGSAAAQFTTVTGTVTDPNGLPYAFGTISPALVSSGSPTLNGFAYTPPQQPVGLNSAGTFTMRLADVSVLVPGGSTWSFTVCSGAGTVQPSFGKASQCFTVTGVSISGASQDISATLHAAATALTANFGTGTGNPCNITNTSVQYDNSGAFGCADLTFATGSPLNAFSSPSSTWTLGATFAATSSLTEFTVNAFPQYSGASGGAINGANLTATDQSSGNGSGTVSSITGANIQGLGSVSSTGQTALVPNIFGVSALARAPFVANVTNERGGYFQVNTGSGTATVTNFRAVEGFVSINTGAGGVVTNSAELYARSPSFGVNGTATHQYGLFVEDQTVGGAQNPDSHGIYVAGGGVQVAVHTFSSLPTCNASQEGRMEAVSDATSATNGATVVGSGAHHVLAYCNSVNWLVVVGT